MNTTLNSFSQIVSTVTSSLPVEHPWDIVDQYSATAALPTWTPIIGDSPQRLVGLTLCHEGKTGTNSQLASRAERLHVGLGGQGECRECILSFDGADFVLEWRCSFLRA